MVSRNEIISQTQKIKADLKNKPKKTAKTEEKKETPKKSQLAE
mgnify:CR=1 FL=1